MNFGENNFIFMMKINILDYFLVKIINLILKINSEHKE
jgi:hypothetical protein